MSLSVEDAAKPVVADFISHIWKDAFDAPNANEQAAVTRGERIYGLVLGAVALRMGTEAMMLATASQVALEARIAALEARIAGQDRAPPAAQVSDALDSFKA